VLYRAFAYILKICLALHVCLSVCLSIQLLCFLSYKDVSLWAYLHLLPIKLNHI